MREHSTGPHARVQVDLAERGVTDIDGEAPLGVETPDADAPLAARPAFPPRPGAAYRLSRSVSTDSDAAASDRDASEDSPGPSADEPGDAAVVTPAADGGEAVAGPTTTTRCPACDHERAAYQLQQTRAADEAPTRLYTCLECSHRWREDD